MGDGCHETWTPRPGVVAERAYLGHAQQLAPRLRLADRREIDAVSGRPPLHVLEDGVIESRYCYALTVDGQVEALFGVRGRVGQFGAIWLLGSYWLTNHPRILVEGMRHFLPRLSQDYRYVGNLMSDEQLIYRRFLQRFGFRFDTEHNYDEGLLLFTKRTDQTNHV